MLAQHPGVFEAAVLGVPDEMMGEKVGAVVVPLPGADLDPREIHTFVKERIADYNAPQYVSFRTEPLPRNPAGKVRKPALRGATVWGDEIR